MGNENELCFLELDNKYNFPKAIKEVILNKSLYSNDTGRSNSKVIFIKNNHYENLYLKINYIESDEKLSDEKEKINWLNNYINVPNIINYSVNNNYEFLLFSEIIGRNSYECTEDIETTINLLALGLETIHKIPINNCPFDNTISMKLLKAKFRVENNLVDENDFEEKYQNANAKDILSFCINNVPVHEDMVFTHGDYCLPNIIISNDNISGFIDLGRSGIADKYQDIALCYRSIIHNFHDEKYANLFLEKYNLKTIDQNKIDYYIALDELF